MFKKFDCPKKICLKKCWSKNIFCPKTILNKRCLVQKKCCPTKVKASKKLVTKSLIKIGSVPAEIFLDVNKCRQDKCYKDKCHSWNLFWMFAGTYLSNSVQIESVIAEILLIWTNVAMTYVARTNVTGTVGI